MTGANGGAEELDICQQRFQMVEKLINSLERQLPGSTASDWDTLLAFFKAERRELAAKLQGKCF
jgi:hypothetical protein